MSWAEIKKAVNSNIDIPLNEYEVCGHRKVITGSTEGNLLNIQGKGLLYLAIANFMGIASSSGRSSRLKITIDGTVILSVAITGITSNVILAEGFICRQEIITPSAVTDTEENIVYIKDLEPMSTDQTITSPIMQRAYALSPVKPLLFNKSLLIQLSNGETSKVQIRETKIVYELL